MTDTVEHLRSQHSPPEAASLESILRHHLPRLVILRAARDEAGEQERVREVCVMDDCPDCYEDSNDAFWMFLACKAHGGGSEARVRHIDPEPEPAPTTPKGD